MRSIFMNELIADVNRFDAEKIRTHAKAFQMR